MGPEARLSDGGAELLGTSPDAREADRPRPKGGPRPSRNRSQELTEDRGLTELGVPVWKSSDRPGAKVIA